MSDPAKIVLVGHCRPDAYALKAALGGRVEGVQFEMVGNQRSLDASIASASLLLVNRVLDGDFDAAGGIDLIKAVRARGDGPPAMLISDLADAQAAAEQAGAAPGFGKRAMYTEETQRRVRAALGRA
jgi:two-component system, chemotaxis family, chemotaxis protein CheY